MIRVNYDDFTMSDYSDLEAAKVGILENFASDTQPDSICEIDDSGNELKQFGAKWSVDLVELEPPTS